VTAKLPALPLIPELINLAASSESSNPQPTKFSSKPFTQTRSSLQTPKLQLRSFFQFCVVSLRGQKGINRAEDILFTSLRRKCPTRLGKSFASNESCPLSNLEENFSDRRILVPKTKKPLSAKDRCYVI